MALSRYLVLSGFALMLMAQASPAAAQGARPKSAVRPQSHRTAPADLDLSRLQADLVRSMTAYRESLEKLLVIYEREWLNLADQVDLRRMLYEKDLLSKRDVEVYERALMKTQKDVEDTRAAIREADLVLIEARVRDELLKLPELPVGGYAETTALIRYNGGAKWTLAGAEQIKKFFLGTFGKALPISAFGQTPVHDRMKFDHKDAMDVAVHPDAPEGQGLIAYLRQAGIPFIAFRNSVAGSATGAHIHIGNPSFRIAAR